ncbi:hypothetical protein AAFF_G00222030 [Aldrovandia affinis]|uniref:Ig-like domain-containing protein n=1 Tax=Aldrovandia affinis TaxID=143900 RepID=A0AAD7RFV8_9TELE|nr:hypothetical protein AAFF_G00222030 [Aldrovandia affinis]
MALRMLWICVIPVALSLELVLEPRKPVSRVGDRLVLKCSARGCQNAAFTWRTLEDQPLMHTSVTQPSPHESHLVIQNMTLDHQATIVCRADCGDGSNHERSATVNVYSSVL